MALTDNTEIEYLVDAMGRRIGKKVNSVLVQGWLYQNSLQPIAEFDGSGNVVSRFVYAGKANVPEYLVRGGATYRLITDQLGSCAYGNENIQRGGLETSGRNAPRREVHRRRNRVRCNGAILHAEMLGA